MDTAESAAAQPSESPMDVEENNDEPQALGREGAWLGPGSVRLFRHQLMSIEQMEALERRQAVLAPGSEITCSMGINANIAGFGKTLEMIGLIERDRMPWDPREAYDEILTAHSNASLMQTTTSVVRSRVRSTLVLISHSMLGHWRSEISKTALTVTVVTNRKTIGLLAESPRDAFPMVVLTVSTMFNDLVRAIPWAWKRFIFDEAGHVRVVGMETPTAGFHWLVSATPKSIIEIGKGQSGRTYQQAIVGYPASRFLAKMAPFTVRIDPAVVTMSFAMPATNHVAHRCRAGVARVVRGLVSADVLTMIEAGDTQGACAALGGMSSRDLVDLVCERKRARVEELDTRLRSLLRIVGTAEAQYPANVLDVMAKLQVARAELEVIRERMRTRLTEECPICRVELNSPVLEPSCQGLFCGPCLIRWMSHSSNGCPLCRAPIVPSDLVFLVSSEGKGPQADGGSIHRPVRPMTRADTCVSIISSRPHGRFLVFSGHDASFEVCRRALTEAGIVHAEVKGTAGTRDRILHDFRGGGVSVLFLNSHTNGAGLNLQCATDVILFHAMDDVQIISRANRIGREVPLTVHHLQDE